jgi:hypothetical protein
MELAKVATVLLQIPSSEAAVERTFSAQDAIHTKKRNRLHDATVQASMFIAFNYRQLHYEPAASTHVRPPIVELSLEFMDTDTEQEDEEEVAQEERKSDDDMEVDEDLGKEVPAEEMRRTYSEIAAGTKSFLMRFITEHAWVHAKMKWNGDYVSALEAAATTENPGGPNTMDLRKQIMAIVKLAAAATPAVASASALLLPQ